MTLLRNLYIPIHGIWWNLFRRRKRTQEFREKVQEVKSKVNNYAINYEPFKGRQIFIDKKFENIKEAVITCYFTGKVDPQHGIIRSEPDYNYIKPWYETLVKRKLKGVILYDCLPEDFIKKYQTPEIFFFRVTLEGYSIFEERWFFYYLILAKTNLKRVFFTDINDVYINNDPFSLFNLKEHEIYVGTDKERLLCDSPWMMKELFQFETDSGRKLSRAIRYMTLFNAGVLGGEKYTIMAFIELMIKEFITANTSNHKDMTVLNYIIFKYMQPKLNWRFSEQEKHKNMPLELISGLPLNSRYKTYDLTSEACFVHK